LYRFFVIFDYLKDAPYNKLGDTQLHQKYLARVFTNPSVAMPAAAMSPLGLPRLPSMPTL